MNRGRELFQMWVVLSCVWFAEKAYDTWQTWPLSRGQHHQPDVQAHLLASAAGALYLPAAGLVFGAVAWCVAQGFRRR